MGEGKKRRLQGGLVLGMAAVLFGGCDCANKQDGNAEDKARATRYCEDQLQWAEWDGMLETYSFNDEMVGLYAMRLGLCSMMLTERLEAERGIRIFDAAHYAMLEKWVQAAADHEARQKKREARRLKKPRQRQERQAEENGAAPAAPSPEAAPLPPP